MSVRRQTRLSSLTGKRMTVTASSRATFGWADNRSFLVRFIEAPKLLKSRSRLELEQILEARFEVDRN